MSWIDLDPLRPSAGSSTRQEVTMFATADKPGRRGRRGRVKLTLRTHLVAGLEWAKKGGAVALRLGSGEHAGKLAVSPGGAFILGGTGGKTPDKTTLCVSLGWPAGCTPQDRSAQACTWQWEGDLFVVNLPSWLVRHAAPAKPAATDATLMAANAAREKAGYVPLDKRVPDPAAADRLAQRGGRA